MLCKPPCGRITNRMSCEIFAVLSLYIRVLWCCAAFVLWRLQDSTDCLLICEHWQFYLRIFLVALLLLLSLFICSRLFEICRQRRHNRRKQAKGAIELSTIRLLLGLRRWLFFVFFFLSKFFWLLILSKIFIVILLLSLGIGDFFVNCFACFYCWLLDVSQCCLLRYTFKQSGTTAATIKHTHTLSYTCACLQNRDIWENKNKSKVLSFVA